MKRNQQNIFLESPNATTPLPWIEEINVNRCDGNPDFSGINEPTLSVLQKSWQDFLDSGKELIVEPDPEPTPEPIPPNWEGFNIAFLTEQNWLTVADLLLQDLRYGIVSTAANGNSEGLQSAVNIAKNYLQSVGQPLTDEVRQIWQAIADANSIPVTF